MEFYRLFINNAYIENITIIYHNKEFIRMLNMYEKGVIFKQTGCFALLFWINPSSTFKMFLKQKYEYGFRFFLQIIWP